MTTESRSQLKVRAERHRKAIATAGPAEVREALDSDDPHQEALRRRREVGRESVKWDAWDMIAECMMHAEACDFSEAPADGFELLRAATNKVEVSDAQGWG